MKVYVAGPMTGYPMLNFLAFFRAERDLASQGYSVINPAKNLGGNTAVECLDAHIENPMKWEDYLRIDIATLLDCDAIYLLRGSHNSRGAKLERLIAEGLGMTVMVEK